MEENARGTVTAEVQGDLVKVSGLVDEAILDTDSRIAIRRNGGDTFEAFPLTLGQEDGSSSPAGGRTGSPAGSSAAFTVRRRQDGSEPSGL